MRSSEPGMERILQAERAIEADWFELGEDIAWALELEKLLLDIVGPLYPHN